MAGPQKRKRFLRLSGLTPTTKTRFGASTSTVLSHGGMFEMVRIAFLLTIIALAAVAGCAQPNELKPPTIEVSGSADILVEPDEVAISLDVTKTNKDLQIAKREADAALAQVIALTRKFDVKPENVKTHYISVEMKYNSVRDPKTRIFDEDGDEIGTKVFLGYEVSTTVAIRMTDVFRFQAFLDEVLKTGISEVDSVKFESSELRKFKDMARENAMKAAFEKASAMAGAIGQKIGKAILVKEGKLTDQTLFTSSNRSSNSTISSFRSGPSVVTSRQSMATFSPGAISINADVSVVFLLN